MSNTAEVQVNIAAPSDLAANALEKFNDVQVELLRQGLKVNKKQFYVFLLQQGLASFDIEALKSSLAE